MIKNVVPLKSYFDPDHILEKAKVVCTGFILIKLREDGELDVRAGGSLDVAQTVYLIELFKHKLLTRDYG